MKVKHIVLGHLEENCYVIENRGYALIIDPGSCPLKIIELVGNNKVLGILVTHYHDDHTGALDYLKAYYKVPVIDYKNIVSNLGIFNFEMINFKGHKDDLIAYYFRNEKIMFTGDFIFKGSIGRCDLDGGNINDIMDSLKRLKTYDKDITLYPGHGDFTTLKEEEKNNIYLKEA